MKIWKVSVCEDCTELELLHKDKEMIINSFYKSGSLLEVWSPIEVKIFKEGNPTDVYSIEGELNPIILNKQALDALDDLIADQVEILPLNSNVQTYYAINVINVLDCIDLAASIPDKFGGFEKYAFSEEKVKNQHIFRTVSYDYNLTDQPIISVLTFISNEFKERIESSGLKGFYIKPVWASETDAFVEHNPRIRATDRQDFMNHLSLHYGNIQSHIPSETDNAGDPEIYVIEPSSKVPYQTVASYGSSYFRSITPANLNSGYAEILMHLPKDAHLTKENWQNQPYRWVVSMMRHFVRNIMQRGYWTGQWLVFPNQSEKDLADTYREMFSQTGVPPHTHILPYNEETLYCGVMIVPPLPQCTEALTMIYREEGNEIIGEWPIYFHTLLPLYREEIIYYFKEGREAFIKKLMANGIESIFDWNRKNSCL